jgi:type I restriction enzyme S subunit
MELTRLKYKATEIGLIPDDWEMKTLGEVGDVRMCKRIFNYQTSERGDIPFFKIGTFGKEPDAYISSTLYNEFRRKYSFPKKGTVLISAAGTIGRTIVYDGNDAYFQDSNIVWIDNNNQIISDEYLKHVFPFVKFNTEGGTIQRLYNSILKSGRFPAPPTLAEQKAIATALSDVDALISSLEKLIAKKKAIKQGAMQELLTPPHNGGKRLVGFSGEWEEINLGKSASLKARIGWQGLTTAEYLDSGDFRLVTGTDFKDGFIDWDNCVYVEKVRFDQDKNIQIKVDDVLVTKDGTIGKVALINELPLPTTLNSGVFVIRSLNNSFDQRFFYYILMSNYFKEFLGKLTAGSTISHLYQKDFIHFNFHRPKSLQEQKEIALILSEMDLEIESLKRKKEKYHQIKQGMMQELLTGKTRLV